VTLGFAHSVYRQPQATMKSVDLAGDYGEKLVSWDTYGLEWIEDLVNSGKARQLRQDGYPMLYVGERDAVAEAVIDHWLDRDLDTRDLYLRAREPEGDSWLQSLGTSTRAGGVTRRILWGVDSVPSVPGLNCDSDLDWIDNLVEQGDAELLEDGEEKLYRGKRRKLTVTYLEKLLAPSREDEALVVTAWDLS